MDPRYHRNPDVVYRPEGLDGAILFDPDSGRVQVVNLTGAFIWERLDGERSLGAICGDLEAAFEAVPDTREHLYGEVQSFVALLVKLGFAASVSS